MIATTALSLAIALAPAPTGDLEVDCKMWDGDQPSTCELSLATKLQEYQQMLTICADMHEAADARADALEVLLIEKPAPEPKSNLSLFGMPGWVTPVLAGVLLGGGIAIGAAL